MVQIDLPSTRCRRICNIGLIRYIYTLKYFMWKHIHIYTYKLNILRHCIILCLFCRKHTLVHWCLYFELNNKIIVIQVAFFFFFFSVNRKWTDLQIACQSSSGKTWEMGTRKAIFWSVTECFKMLSSQCNLTAQIEPMQDK